MDRAEGAVTATEILIEAVENIDTRGISKVIVLCFDSDGYPLGWLSNVGNHVERLGLMTLGHQAIMELPSDNEEED